MIMTNYLNKLRKIESDLLHLKENKQINPKIADDFIKIGQNKIRLFLEELFKDKYPNLIKPNKYSNFILYSYKSYYGDIPAQSSDKKIVYKGRLNLFHKGKRWSNGRGKVFYDFLDKINDKFGDTPVNLFGELCSKKSIQHLIIKVVDEFECNLPDNTIFLPTDKFLEKMQIQNNIAAHFATYIDSISKPDFDDDLDKLAGIEKTLENFKVDSFIEESKKNKDLMKFVKQISDFFHLSTSDRKSFSDRIIKTIFSYQFNDLRPTYDLNLFFPKSKEKEFLSTLMIAVDTGQNLDKKDLTFFEDLSQNLLFLDQYEKDIVERTRKNNDSYIIWKKIYEREYDKLFSFMKSVENICFSICKQNDIKFSHISGRVKTFDSLYNKIFIRSNDEFENQTLKDAAGITYLDAINEPHIHYHKIFQVIKDLAGVRVVLLFESDLESILKIFNKISNKEEVGSRDLVLKEKKFYKQSMKDSDNSKFPADKKASWGYRSLHLTVKPGLERLKLTEFKNLRDVQCEIQFRTVLAHAWADVNHDLEYKNREVYAEIFPDSKGFLKDDFTNLSKSLLNNDKSLNRIKKKSDSIKIE